MATDIVSQIGVDSGCSIVSPSQKKQRCEGEQQKERFEDDPQPPTSVEEQTDRGQNIEIYKYDSDVEDDSDGMHEMTAKEFEDYDRQITDSDGFDVKLFPRTFSCGMIQPIVRLDNVADEMKDFTELALKDFNDKEGKNLEFVKVLKVNFGGCAGVMLYITSEVKDDEGNTAEFEAKVWEGIRENKVLIRRLKTSTR